MIKEIRNIETNELTGYQYNGATVPLDPSNRHYQEIQELIKNGEKPEEAFSIKELQASKIRELKQKCSKQITSGFTSNALGSDYIYQSEQIDQLNLIGMVTAGVDDVFKCSPDGSNWSYELHTIDQLEQVLADGKAAKQTALAKYEWLKAEVNNATTRSELDAIQW